MSIKIPQVREAPLPSSTGIRTPDANAFGAGLAQSIGQFGGTLGGVALDLQHRENDARVKEADAKLYKLTEAAKSDYQTLRGRDAWDGRQFFRDRIARAKADAMDSLTNPAQRELFNTLATRREAHSFAFAEGYAQDQLLAYERQASVARFNVAKQAMVDATDIDSAVEAKATLVAELRQQASAAGMPPEQAQLILDQTVSDVHVERIKRLQAPGDLNAVRAAAEYYADHEDEVLPAMRSNVERTLRVLAEHDRARKASDLELSVRRGAGSRAAIDAAFENGLISGSKRTALHAFMDQQFKLHEDKRAVGSVVAYGGQLDYKNKDHKVAVEALFDEVVANDKSFETRKAAALRFANSGILPEQIQRDIRVHSRSGTPKQIVETAMIVQQVSEEAPSTLSDVKAADLALFDTVAVMHASGVPAEEAVTIALENAKLADTQRDALDAKLQRDMKDDGDGNPVALQSLLDGSDYDTSFFSGAPAAAPMMQGEFDVLVGEYYRATGGNLPQARQLAFKALRRTWSPTGINGSGQLMRYAPERDFGLSASQLRDNLLEELGEIGFQSLDEVRVVSDNLTARAPRGQRSYGVYRITEDGLPQVIRGANNLPLRWVPNAAAIIDKAHQRDLEEARALQARRWDAPDPVPAGAGE
ncbi:MAG: hypothetical protein KDJ27_19160 [Gammaproteobacteria bacterium]|nr:hypothetical protein [Gammaproteobacteria bacterium]